MRLIKSYCFNVGTKIPYSEWPSIIHQFLAEQNLTSHRFMYHFEDFLDRNESFEEMSKRRGCAKLLKDCPELGEIRLLENKRPYGAHTMCLSNIDLDNDITDAPLMPLMKKIHRRYGMVECNLYYYDIDFFGEVIPIVREPSEAFFCSFYGSGITLSRDICGDNFISLDIDLLHNGIVMDATPYYEALHALLPKVRASEQLTVFLSEEEQRRVDAATQAAAPILEQCRAFFTDQFSESVPQNRFESYYSIAKPLKKLARQYGYTYKKIYQSYVFSIEKRTTRGNVLFLEVQTNPSHLELNYRLSFQGVGFKHTLGRSFQAPSDQADVDASLEHVLLVLTEFEQTMLPELDAQFPETPDWFVPTDN